MNRTMPVTSGANHVGLTVLKLEESAAFFIDVLSWSEVKRDDDYPAIFVTDGVLMISLWGVKSVLPKIFDRKENVGLHHLALSVKTIIDLDLIHIILKEHNIEIEFSPELLRGGPAKHMMCYEPSGIRVEFICIPK
jgi:catechol 2,3-dioxygenase-like lactoylglutathione lyase family enzyme